MSALSGAKFTSSSISLIQHIVLTRRECANFRWGKFHKDSAIWKAACWISRARIIWEYLIFKKKGRGGGRITCLKFRNRNVRKCKDFKIWMVQPSERVQTRAAKDGGEHLDPSFSLSVETDRSGELEEGRKRSLVRLDGRKYLRGEGSRAAEVTKLPCRWLNALNRRGKFSLLIISKGRTCSPVHLIRAPVVTTKEKANTKGI